MITLTREEAQQVLKVLEYPGPSWPESRTELAVALRYKLAEPEPEPTGFIRTLVKIHTDGTETWKDEPFYTTTPQREWQNAAIRLGEELSSVGPDGYYNMTAQQWLDWALDQQPRGKNSLPAPREWQSLTDEDRQELAAKQYGWEGLCSAVEAKLREKNCAPNI